MDKVDHLSSSPGEETEGARRATGVSSPGLEPAPPNPEVLVKKTRRRLTTKYKIEILEKADKCLKTGDIGALLRREGLYSSQLAKWRKLRREGFFKQTQPRGRPGLTDIEKQQKIRISELENRVQSLEKEIDKATAIIDIQKKLSKLLELTSLENNGTAS